MFAAKKTLVVLDTNALLLPATGVDVFSLLVEALDTPYRLATLKCVIAELEVLMAKKSVEGFAAKLGFILAKQKALKILSCSSKTHADDCFVELADPKKMIVVTQDKVLIARLRAKGVPCLRYQQKKFVFQA